MDNRLNHVPQYIKIKEYLLSLIAEKKPNDIIPSENELAAAFSVSRGTAKQAVMELVNEGQLYRCQGKGTFICEPMISRSFETLPSFTEDIRRYHKNPSTKVLTLQSVDPTARVRTLFNLCSGERVIKFKRVVSAEEVPVAVVTSYLNPHVYPKFQLCDFEDSLYRALNKKYGIVPTKAQDTYSIVDITPKTAARLKCNKIGSVCFSQRIAYLADDTIVEYVESFIRSDRFKLNICVGDIARNGEVQNSEYQNQVRFQDAVHL